MLTDAYQYMTDPLEERARADVLLARSSHDQWALHKFAIETDKTWMPTHLRQYHEGRYINGELMEGYYDEFIPDAYDADRGQVLKKEIDEQTLVCDDCEIPARKNESGEAQCPKCGLICKDTEHTFNIISDEKSADRVANQSGYYGN